MECEEVRPMYKRSKTDNRFFLDISKPGKISPAKMPKSMEKRSSKTTLSTKKFEDKNNLYRVRISTNDDNKKWKKTDEWKPLW